MSDNSVRVIITTALQIITGDLSLPDASVVNDPTIENLLFYTLNCGNKFITLKNCYIENPNSNEFQSERAACYNINLDIVHSCQIVDNSR